MQIDVNKLFQKLGEQLVTIQLLQEQIAELESKLAKAQEPCTPPVSPENG
jgi:hypothetical protein